MVASRRIKAFVALVVLFILSDCSHASKPQKEKTFEQKIAEAQGMVVQIVVKLAPEDMSKLEEIGKTNTEAARQYAGLNSDPLKMWVVGTGFIINRRGDIATADHVVAGIADFYRKMVRFQINAHAYACLFQPNVETPDFYYSSNCRSSYVTPIAEDGIHDTAVLRSTPNILTQTEPFPADVVGKVPPLNAKPVVFSLKRPADGDDVFSIGFPLGAHNMISTSGRIGSAWSKKILAYPQQYGSSEMSDAYVLDLRINPGNSGGALFSTADESVLGIIVQVEQSPQGGEGQSVAVSISYLRDLLTKNNIPWNEEQRK